MKIIGRRAAVLLLIGLCLGLTIPKMQAEAAHPVSHGTFIYAEGKDAVSLYASDILLLEERISAVPDCCFDPACYAHIHRWEYCGINERTHTRHCADCGTSNDLTSVHRAEHCENDTISYEGQSYPVRRFTCACGYQWSTELAHTVIYEAVDGTTHRSRCALDGTSYCKGFEPFVEEHYAWYYEMSEDDNHHVKICLDCGFRMEEDCSFGEAEGEDNPGICICGRNAELKAPDEPETGKETENPDESGTGEEPGSSDEPGTGEESGGSDGPGTGEEPGGSDGPGTGEEPGGSDEPGTGEESGGSGEPGTGEEPGGSDKPGTGEEPGGPDGPGTGDDTGGPDEPGAGGEAGDSDEPRTGEPPIMPTGRISKIIKGGLGIYEKNKE